jgi:hypothetical protein
MQSAFSTVKLNPSEEIQHEIPPDAMLYILNLPSLNLTTRGMPWPLSPPKAFPTFVKIFPSVESAITIP